MHQYFTNLYRNSPCSITGKYLPKRNDGSSDTFTYSLWQVIDFSLITLKHSWLFHNLRASSLQAICLVTVQHTVCYFSSSNNAISVFEGKHIYQRLRQRTQSIQSYQTFKVFFSCLLFCDHLYHKHLKTNSFAVKARV